MVIQYFPTVVVELPKLATKSSMTFHIITRVYAADIELFYRFEISVAPRSLWVKFNCFRFILSSEAKKDSLNDAQ